MRSILGLENGKDAEEESRTITRSMTAEYFPQSHGENTLTHTKEPILSHSLRASTGLVNMKTASAPLQIKSNNPLLVDNSSALALYYKNYGGLQVRKLACRLWLHVVDCVSFLVLFLSRLALQV